MLAYINPYLSAEMLGAYLEGNLSENEMEQIHNIISNDQELTGLVNDIVDFETDWNTDIYNDNPNFDSLFVMPEIESLENSTILDDSENSDNHDFFIADNEMNENGETDENSVNIIPVIEPEYSHDQDVYDKDIYAETNDEGNDYSQDVTID